MAQTADGVHISCKESQSVMENFRKTIKCCLKKDALWAYQEKIAEAVLVIWIASKISTEFFSAWISSLTGSKLSESNTTGSELLGYMFGPGKGLDDRACELRTKRLLESHEADELRNRSKSGTEEQYQQINALLIKISQAKKDAPPYKEDKAGKAGKDAAKAMKETELAAANEIIVEAGEETYSPMSIQQDDEMTDEAMVEMGILDPAELNRGQPPQDDNLVNAGAGTSGKKVPSLPERRKRKPTNKDDDEDLITYMTKSDEDKKQVRELELAHSKNVRVLELQAQKEMKELELKEQKEIRELELAHKREMEDKRQETEKVRIAAEAQKWEALLALIAKR